MLKVPTEFERAMMWAVRMYMGMKQQHWRILPQQEDTVRWMGTRELDAMTFAWICNNFRMQAQLACEVSAEPAKGAITRAIAQFDGEAPHVKDLRDVFSHLEDYLVGKGRRQKGLTNPWLNIYYGAGKDYTLYVALGDGLQLQIEVDRTTTAAGELLSAVDYAVDPDHPAKAHLPEADRATTVNLPAS